LAKVSGITISSNEKLNNVEGLQSSGSYELWRPKLSGIFELRGLHEIIVLGIDQLTLGSPERLITFQVTQRQGLLVTIQVMSKKILSKIPNCKILHNNQIYLQTASRCNSTYSDVFVLRSFIGIEQRINLAKVSQLKFIFVFRPKWNQITYLSQSSTARSSTDCKIVKDLFACQEAKSHFLQAYLAESHDNIVENLWSKDNLTYHDAKEHVLNHCHNHHSSTGATSKNSKAEHETNSISLLNGKTANKKKTGSFVSSKSGGKSCNWYRKYSLGTVSSHL
jgi:hypothetical protein